MGIIETIVHEAKKQAAVKGRAEGREQGLEQGREQGLEQGREQGLEQGREQGMEQGMELGMEKGKTETQVEMVKRLLQSEFFLKGMMTYQHIADLTLMPVKQIKQIHAQINTNLK